MTETFKIETAENFTIIKDKVSLGHNFFLCIWASEIEVNTMKNILFWQLNLNKKILAIHLYILCSMKWWFDYKRWAVGRSIYPHLKPYHKQMIFFHLKINIRGFSKVDGFLICCQSIGDIFNSFHNIIKLYQILFSHQHCETVAW